MPIYYLLLLIYYNLFQRTASCRWLKSPANTTPDEFADVFVKKPGLYSIGMQTFVARRWSVEREREREREIY